MVPIHSRLVRAAAISFLLIATVGCGAVERVYVTRHGNRYHSENCGALGKSRIPVTLDDATRQGYTPCLKCNPPELRSKK